MSETQGTVVKHGMERDEYPSSVNIGGMRLDETCMREAFFYYEQHHEGRQRRIEVIGAEPHCKWRLFIDDVPEAESARTFETRKEARKAAFDVLPLPQLVGGYRMVGGHAD